MICGKATASRSVCLEAVLATIVLVLCSVMFLAVDAAKNEAPVRLLAENGVTTIPATALDQRGVVALDGPWKMYWGRLLAPDDLARPYAPVPDGVLDLPGSWRGLRVGDRELGGTGEATLRLRLVPPPGDLSLTLRLFDLRVAYRLWADGMLIAESGQPGKDVTSERPDRSLILAPFATHGEAVDLVLQLSNQRFRSGGVGHAILLAKQGILEADRSHRWIVSALFCGVLFVAGIYHLLLYALRSREISFLYFGIYALLLFGYAANSNSTDWLSRELLPASVEPQAIEAFSLGCYAISGAILFRFYQSVFPEYFSRSIMMVSDLRFPVYLASSLLLPAVWTSWLIQFLMLIGLLFTAYFLVRLTVCAWHRRPGAILLLCGAVLLAFTSIHDVLVHTDAIGGRYFILYGMFALVMFQSSALALRHADSIATIRRLSDDLGRHVEALTAEMHRRRELENEIINVSEEERCRVSHQLHDGLCQQLTAARISFSMLSAAAGAKDSAALASLGALLSAATEDAYALSKGLWPVERDDAAAGPALAEMIAQAERSSGIRIALRQQWPCPNCDDRTVRALHRIVQEAVANAIKHSEATRIDVSLICHTDGVIDLNVSDNGVGCVATIQAATVGGLGLRIMAHRAHSVGSRLVVEDAPGGGTSVTCQARCARCTTEANRT